MSDQGQDWIWYPDGQSVEQYGAKGDYDFQLLAAPLPICEACDKFVKPGEDLCWDCLGEPFPVPEYEYYVYGTQNFTNRVYSTYPVAMGTSTYSTIHFNASSMTQVNSVTIAGVSTTFNPPITMVNGDTLQIKYNADGTL